MINGTGVFYAERSSHYATVSRKRGNVNTKDLTLYSVLYSDPILLDVNQIVPADIADTAVK